MCREREVERPLQRCAKGIWSSHSGGTVPENTAGVTQPDMWYCSLESIVVIILVSTLHYISTQQGRGTWNNYPRSKRCHSSSQIRASENRWWVWPAIQGRAEAHPSLSNLKEPQRSQGSAKAALREAKYNEWLVNTLTCLGIQRVCGEGGLCSLPVLARLPTAQIPTAQQGTALPSLLWPPCGHGVAQHGTAKLLWDPLTAPETSKDWLFCLIWTRQNK